MRTAWTDDKGRMLAADQITNGLAGLANRTSADFWVGVIAMCVPVLAAGIFAIVLVGTRRVLGRRIDSLENRTIESANSVSNGPTVREFCRDLAAALRMRLPRVKLPVAGESEEVAFIRGVLIHLKARRRHHLTIENGIEQLRQEVSTAREEIALLRLTKIARNNELISNSPTPEPFEVPSDELAAEPEFDALLTQASESLSATTLALSEGDENVDDFLAHAIADEPPSTIEIKSESSLDIAEISLEANLSSAGPTMEALESLLEQARETLKQHRSIRETVSRAETLAIKLDQMEQRWTEQSVSAAALLVRVDDRLDDLQRMTAAARDPISPPARSRNIPASGEFDSPNLSEVRAETESLRAVLADAVLEGQRLAELRADANNTLNSLSELNMSLTKGMTSRRELLGKIDSKLQERQLALAADISRAETGQIDQAEFLQRIEATVQSIIGLIEQPRPTKPATRKKPTNRK